VAERSSLLNSQSNLASRCSFLHNQNVRIIFRNTLTVSSKKVKQSHYRPGQAKRVLRKLSFPDFVTKAQDGGKVVGLTHRPPLLPGNAPGTHFC